MRINKLGVMAAIALGGLLACSTMAMAQDAKDGKKKDGKGGFSVEQRLDRMTERLSLTDEQKPKVKAVLEESAKKMQDVPREERREKMPAIREEENTKIKAILTPEQTEKWEKMRSEFRKKGGPGGDKKSDAPKKD